MSTRRDLVVDTGASHLALRTRSKGLLARLAHDLEIRNDAVTGKATLDGDAWTGELSIPVEAFRVAGVLHGDTLDPDGLGAADRAEVERKVRDEVFEGTKAIRANAAGPARAGGSGKVALARKEAPTSVDLRAVVERPAGGFVVKGRATVSLAALDVREVKGPLGAFRVADTVEILFELALSPA
jgi:hypothetical protein